MKQFINALALTLVLSVYAQAQCVKPVINDFTPKTGFIGSTVTIVGANFETVNIDDNVVYFGATKATVLSANFGQLEVTVPVGSTTSYITVTTTCSLTTRSAVPFNGIFCPSPLTATTYQNVAQELTGVNGAYNMVPIDLDLDGKPEVVSARNGSTYTIAVNNSTPGNINFGRINLSGGGSTNGVYISDMDNDGYKDIVFPSTVVPNLSTSPGTITMGSPVSTGLGGDYQVAAGDFNNDGKMDIIAEIGNNMYVSRNQTTGPGNFNFATRQSIYSAGGNVTGIHTGDIDGDGKTDVVMSMRNNNRAISMRNITPDGSTIFSFEPFEIWNVGGTQPYRSLIADFDKDGKIDFTTCNYSGIFNTAVLRNNSTVGDIVFDAPVNLPSPNTNYRIGVGDVDGDGFPDIVTKSLGINVFAVYRNKSTPGNLSFDPRFDYTSSSRAEVSGIVIGDLDGDFVPDIATSGISSNTIRFHRNTSAQNDVSDPIALCKDVTLPVGDSGNATLTPAMVDNGSSDECGIDFMTLSKTDFTCADLGDVPVTLAVTDNSGNASSCQSIVTVSAAEVSITGQSTVCAGETVNVNSSSGDSYQWYKDGIAVAGETSSSLVISETGLYSVEISSSSGCGGLSPEVLITVNQNPTVSVTPSPTALLCGGDVTLTASSSAIYQWQFNGTDIAGANLQSYTATQVGDYTVSVIDIFGCSAVSDPVYATDVIVDNTPPVINCPPDVTVGTDIGACVHTSQAYGMATATDDCADPVLISNDASTTLPLGTNTITWTADDTRGNTADCTQQVTVADLEDPSLTCLPSLEVALDDNGQIVLDPEGIGATASDNCSSDLDFNLDLDTFGCDDIGEVVSNSLGLDFDGQNDYVRVPASFNNQLSTEAITVETWVNYSSAASIAVLIGEAYLGDSKVGFTIYHDSGTSWYAGFFSPGWTRTNLFNIPKDVWTHVAVSYDRSSMDVYIDGNLVTSLNTSTVIPIGSEEWRFANGWSSARTVNGIMDEVRIWNVARTQAEIQATMNTPLSGTEAGLAGYWSLDDGTGSALAADLTGNGNDGTLISMDANSDWVDGAPALINLGDPVVLTVTDEAGNISTCQTGIIVIDDTVPVLTCPEDLIVSTDAGSCEATVTLVPATVTDNCQSLAASSNALATYGPGDYIVTWSVDDGNGYSDDCDQNITVEDNEDPVITCPADINLLAISAAGAPVNFTPSVGTDNCSATTSQTAGQASGSTFAIGTTVNTYMVVDDSGNEADCSFDVNVTGLAPDVNCPDDMVVNTEAGSCDAVVTYAATETTAIPASIISYDIDPGSFLQEGTTTITATATNAVGSSGCSFTVTVEDNEVPIISCPDDIVISTSSSACEAFDVDLGEATVSDNCTANPNVTIDGLTDLPLFYIGERGGNFSSLTTDGVRTVVASIPAADGVLFLNSTTAIVTRFANSPDNILSVDIPTGTTTPLASTGGVTQGMDLDANGDLLLTNEGLKKIQRLDLQTNVLTDVVTGLNRPIDVIVESPNTILISEYNFGSILRYDLTTGITTTVGTGFGRPTDIFLASNGDLLIAENGGAVSRLDVTTGVRTVIDVQGGAFGPHGIAEDLDGNIYVANFSLGKVYKIEPGGSSVELQNGFAAPVFIARRPSNIFQLGINTLTYTVEDAAGNSADCIQTITVEDNEVPVISCPSDVNVLATSAAGATVDYTAPVGTDNCTPLTSQTAGLASGSTFPIGTTSNVFTVTDVSGNASNCSFDVIVTGIAPDITCPANMVVDTDNGSCDAIVNYAATETTAIPASTISYNTDSGSVFTLGTVTITATAVNAVGSDVCSFTVTVEDNEAPQLNCPDDITVSCDDDTTPLEGCNVADAVFDNLNASGPQFIDFNFVPINDFEITVDYQIYTPVIATPTFEINYFEPVNYFAVAYEPLQAVTVCDITCYNHAGTAIGTSTLTLDPQASDVIGISSSQPVSSFTITTIDATPVTFTEVTSATCVVGYPATEDNCGTAVSYSDVSTQNVDGMADSADDYNYEITRTWTSTDPSGNATSCTHVVTVVDTDAPTALCLATMNVSLDVDGSSSISEADIDLGSSDVCSSVTTNLDLTAFDCTNIGDNIIMLTVTDVSGNQATCLSTVNVEDKIAPQALCQDVTVQLDVNGEGTTTAALVNDGSSDACGIQSLDLSQTDFDCTQVTLSNSVTLTVTDTNGNVSACDATVTVEDNINPSLTCPADLVVSTDAGLCVATQVDLGVPVVSDNCATIVPVNNTNDSYLLGDNAVVWTADDGNGNVVSCTQTIAVEDTEAPEVNCPSDIVVDTDSDQCHAVVTYDVPFSDNCSVAANVNGDTLNGADFLFDFADQVDEQQFSPGLPIIFSPTQGNYMGIFLQRCSATHMMYQDVTIDAGVSSTLSLDLQYTNHAGGFSAGQYIAIEIRDLGSNAVIETLFTTAPGDPVSIPMTNFTFDVSAYAGQTVRVCIINATIFDYFFDVLFDNIAISNSSLVNGSFETGDYAGWNLFSSNSTCGTWGIGQGGSTALVQSEGLSSGSDFPVGTTTNAFIVTDAVGNTSSCSFSVVVEDNENPSALCQNVTVQLDDNGDGSTSEALVNDGSADACGIQSLELSQTDFDCTQVGANTVTLTITDVNGKVGACDATVTVEDNVAPVASCQAHTVQLDAAGAGNLVAADIDGSSSDACGVSLVAGQTSFDCTEVGSNTVTLTVTDDNGNVSVCDATVTVEDNVAPVATCQAHTVQLDAVGAGSLTAGDIDGGSSDACGISQLVAGQTAFDCSHVGSNTVTLTVTDNNGNVSDCDATVTVEDNVAPVATCQAHTVQLDAAGAGSLTAADIDGGSSDACGVSLVAGQTSFDCTHVGANTVTLTVTDDNGNVSACDATVTLEDNVAPDAICQDIVVIADSNGDGFIDPEDVDDGSSDACGVTLSVDVSSFSCNTGDYPVVLTVTDDNGNATACDATVTFEGDDGDCDTVLDACDLCNGGNDTVDNNNDGLPDCAYPPHFDDIIDDWKCGNNLKKVLVCHLPPGNPANAQTICISKNAVSTHVPNHGGDYIGSCFEANCGTANSIIGGKGTHLLQRSQEDTHSDSHFEFNVYPNPARTELYLSIHAHTEVNYDVHIIDELGRVVFEKGNVTDYKLVLDPQLWTPGMYSVKVINQNEIYTKNLVIMK